MGPSEWDASLTFDLGLLYTIQDKTVYQTKAKAFNQYFSTLVEQSHVSHSLLFIFLDLACANSLKSKKVLIYTGQTCNS